MIINKNKLKKEMNLLPFLIRYSKLMTGGELQARQTLSGNISLYDWSATEEGRDCNLGYRRAGRGMQERVAED